MSIHKFDGRAKDYSVSRPGYSLELIESMYNNYGLSNISVIADVGSGTGKFSKYLLDRGSYVFGIEPNKDMRTIAENKLSKYVNFHSVEGNEKNMSIENNTVDCITVAQAFHWFDVRKFKEECIRVTKSSSKAFLIWNVREQSDSINKEWHEIFAQYCPNFNGFSNGIKQDDEKIKFFFDKGYDYIEYNYPLTFDRESFIKRSLSSSYSLKECDKNYKLYVEKLNNLFDKYKCNNVISIANKTVAYIGCIK